MRHLRGALGTALVAVVASAAFAGSQPAVEAERPNIALVDAAPSVETLVERFLDALAAKDGARLHRLRVTETEYRELIMPGAVKPGEKLQIFPDEDSKFFWGMLDTKSIYAAVGFLRDYGGRALTLKGIGYQSDGRIQYAWYEAYRAPRITVVDTEGEELALLIGSIAIVDGRYKFISFAADH